MCEEAEEKRCEEMKDRKAKETLLRTYILQATAGLYSRSAAADDDGLHSTGRQAGGARQADRPTG